MSDIFLQQFYNDVKDPLWPDIGNYCDYTQLPDHIKAECRKLYNVESRINEITSVEYWRKKMLWGYQYKNLVYVPVTKCAHSYYCDVFENQLGWKKIMLNTVDHNNNIMFGLVMHPLTRFLKGTTQWLWDAYGTTDSLDLLETDLSHPRIQYLIESVILGDLHTLPYSITFGPLLQHINWIPMDVFTDNEIKISLENLFENHNHNIKLPDNPRMNQSNKQKLKLFNTIKTLYQSSHSNGRLYHLYYVYSDDLKFFHNLIDTFTPNWQHI